MRVAITGASGFIGRALVSALIDRGDKVVAASRVASDTAQLRWTPRDGFDPVSALSGFDAVVHLAGASIAAGRWTPERKRELRDSRVHGTRSVVHALDKAEPRPPVFVCASAVGLYGERGDEACDEDSKRGGGFLADITQAWESEALAAERLHGIRVVRARFGVVLGRNGGALPRMLPAFRFGLGGRLGAGSQYMSWIHIDDVVSALLYVLDTASTHGAYNITAPAPVPNTTFTRALGRALHRPTLFGVPRFALRMAFGEMGETLLLNGQRVLPQRLLDAGFRFSFGEIDAALEDLTAN